MATDQSHKKDAGKPLAACILDFPHALQAVSVVATFGAAKYARGSWRTVPNGLQRYEDAMIRHLLAHKTGEKNDPESGIPHLHHALWNFLAIVELDSK